MEFIKYFKKIKMLCPSIYSNKNSDQFKITGGLRKAYLQASNSEQKGGPLKETKT